MSAELAFEARDVTKTYGTRRALDGVCLRVERGEMVALIGPSGSGKSSLLHAAGLLEKPNGGTVILDGVDATKMGDGPRTRLRLNTIGFVYQFHHLLPEFSALDNVALPAMIAGMKRKAARERAEELLTRMGLADRMQHQPAQLSGGEQQRVAIARALTNRPRMILADEPTGNLDPTTSGAVFQSLFELARIQGVAALIATHNRELASYMDRVFTIADGHLVERR